MECVAMMHILFIVYVITTMLTSMSIRCQFYGKECLMIPILAIMTTFLFIWIYSIAFRNDDDYNYKILALIGMTMLLLSIDPFRYLTPRRTIMVLIVLMVLTYGDYKIQKTDLEQSGKYDTVIHVSKTSNEVLFACLHKN